MIKGEAFVKHLDINKSVTLKTWLGLTPQEKAEYREDLNFANIEGDITVDVFCATIKEGMPVYEFAVKGVKAYCTVINYFKLSPGQKKQFKTAASPFPGNKGA